MSGLTHILTAPWRGLRRWHSLVRDDDHDDWLDQHASHQRSKGPERDGFYERATRFLSSGGGSGGAT